ncbi:hypothetical protein OFN25_32820, partial [Escherichia coli]|nr:hypothetical protein [Escherichia coli]
KGKKSQVAITAVARELTGFMWDIALAAQSSFSQSAEAKLNPEAVRHGMSDPRKRIQGSQNALIPARRKRPAHCVNRHGAK